MAVFQIVKRIGSQYQESLPQKGKSSEQLLAVLKNCEAEPKNFSFAIISREEITKLVGTIEVKTLESVDWFHEELILGPVERDQTLTFIPVLVA